MEDEFVRLKYTYKDLTLGKLKVDTENEQRIEQYNTEIKDNKEENERLQGRIIELEDDIDRVMTKFEKEVDKITTHSKAEVHTYTSKIEDLAVKFDKVEQFEAEERKLREAL
jgi:signal transduction protein with GAF and PtsI domain